ncbi:NAD kinase [Halocola ammonii]
MTIAFYGLQFGADFNPVVQAIFDGLQKRNTELIVHEDFAKFLKERIRFDSDFKTFKDHRGLESVDCLISIGGDGTLLSTIHFVRDSGIPVLGVNAGRLGFLSHVSADQVAEAIEDLLDRKYSIDERSLIKVSSPQQDFGDFPFALNEVTVHKKDTSSMVRIHAYLDETYINTYWADGLIVCTPTGSTAYSLSCNGPIVMPGSENFTITPIAPHNLNVRPLVVPNRHKLRLKAEGREPNFLMALDSISHSVSANTDIIIENASFSLNLINLEGRSFFNTIRNKLMWGADRRN